MRVILIDYGGTLTRITEAERADFVRKLVSNGDWPCLHTGNDIRGLRQFEPDMMCAVRDVFQKGKHTLNDVVDRLRCPTDQVTEVILVDDEPHMWRGLTERANARKIGGWPWRFVDAMDIHTLLNTEPTP